MKSRLFSLAIYLTATISGMLVLLYPFFLPVILRQTGFGMMRTGEMPLMMTFLLGLCLVALLFEAQGQMVNTKLVALLGILVAINSALRFIETAIPGPGGFTPIFFLIILVGYVFGGRAGFLMGALTLLVSALVTGGVGPWLPAQMFTAGWVGMSVIILRPLVNVIGKESAGILLKQSDGNLPAGWFWIAVGLLIWRDYEPVAVAIHRWTAKSILCCRDGIPGDCASLPGFLPGHLTGMGCSSCHWECAVVIGAWGTGITRITPIPPAFRVHILTRDKRGSSQAGR